MSSENKVWLITGVNNGLGLVLAQIVAKAGHTVIGTVRALSKFPASLKELGVEPLEIEVTAPEEIIVGAVQGVAAKHGRIDVLVNNAGFGHWGSLEETTDAESKYQFDVNVFGLMNFIRGVLPSMRAQKSGVIINMSSLGGFMGGPGASLYCASKFAVEGLSESLKAEVAEFGVRVHVVEPGFFRTSFLGKAGSGAAHLSRRIDAYPDFDGALADFNGTQNGDPEKGMQRLYELATLTGMCAGFQDQLRIQLGPDSYGGLKGKIDSLLKEAENSKEVAHSTDIPGAAPIAWGSNGTQ